VELEAAARRHLLTDSTITGYVAGRVEPFRLKRRVDPHGTRAIVIERGPAWSETERYEGASAEFPTLAIRCWADSTRDNDGNVTSLNRVENAYAVWRAVHNFIHNRRPGQIWGRTGSNPGLLVNTCSLWAGPTHLDGQGSINGVPVGEAAVVTASYAMNVAHLSG
jgi:hypothetical protein